jgi:uncharacterized coiled-coil DUF342 family protein
MSEETTQKDQPSPSFKELQDQIEDLREKRDELNKKTKSYITNLQEIESQITEALQTAKDVYKKKRDFWNDKVKKLKDKKIEYKIILDNFVEEKKQAQKSKNAKGNKNQARYVDLKQVNRKIENLERIIETEKLNITEENAIIDQIRELAETKQEFMETQQDEDFIKLNRKIEIVKVSLNKIYEQLNKWSNKSQDNHAKMLELYDKVNELKENKKRMEEDLIKNKQAADDYHGQFLELMNQRKKLPKSKRPYNSSNRGNRPSKRPKKMTFNNRRANENKMLAKMKQEKLASALEKQKAGKKLNLYEARLIFEKSYKVVKK